MSTRAKLPFDILTLDDRVVAVNKPAGIPVVPARSGQDDSLRALLTERLGGRKLYVVHRIDRDTSGVVLFARDRASHRALSMMFQRGEMRKTYLALVVGRPVPAEGTIDLALKVDRRDATRMRAVRRGGKPSRTDYTTLETFRGHSLLEVHPLTGRTHQVRVHLAAIGHPLAVDPVYGGAGALYLSEFKRGYRRKESRRERPLISRLTLHAREICFENPFSRGGRCRIEASLSSDFELCLKQLAKYASVQSRGR